MTTPMLARTMTTDSSILDLLGGLRELAEAEPGYVEAKQHFENSAPEWIASPALARRLRKAGKRFRVNIGRKAVTSVTDRLQIAAVTVQGNKAATERLQVEVWQANQLGLEAPIVHERACEFGDEYVFMSQNEAGEIEIERSGALSTRIIYDEESPRRPRYGIKAWQVTAGIDPESKAEIKRTRVNLYYPPDDEGGGRIERWISLVGVERPTDPEHWQRYERTDPDSGDEIVPFTEELERFPIYHFRTGRPYGVPLHRESYGAQDAVNKLLVTMMGTIDQQGFPIRYALAADGSSEGDSDLDDFGSLDDPDETGVTDEDIKREQSSKLRSGPGEFWWLTGAKGAGQFTPADPKVFLDPADWYVRMSAQATDTPLHMYDPGGDQPSGDSRRAALDSLVKRVSWVSLSFGATWKQLLGDAMDLLGVRDAAVDVRWAPFDPVDDVEGWTTVKAKIDAGVPVKQALMEAGYEAEQVDEWLKTSTEQDLARRVDLLARLASAARDLGTASATGVLPEGTVQAILDGIIGPVDEGGDGVPAG